MELFESNVRLHPTFFTVSIVLLTYLYEHNVFVMYTLLYFQPYILAIIQVCCATFRYIPSRIYRIFLEAFPKLI